MERGQDTISDQTFIRIFPFGQPRITPGIVTAALKELAEIFPKVTKSDLKLVRELLESRINNKENQLHTITFSTGVERSLDKDGPCSEFDPRKVPNRKHLSEKEIRASLWVKLVTDRIEELAIFGIFFYLARKHKAEEAHP